MTTRVFAVCGALAFASARADDKGAWDVQTWTDHLVTGYEGDTFGLTVVSVGADRWRFDDPTIVIPTPANAKPAG